MKGLLIKWGNGDWIVIGCIYIGLGLSNGKRDVEEYKVIGIGYWILNCSGKLIVEVLEYCCCEVEILVLC